MSCRGKLGCRAERGRGGEGRREGGSEGREGGRVGMPGMMEFCS